MLERYPSLFAAALALLGCGCMKPNPLIHELHERHELDAGDDGDGDGDDHDDGDSSSFSDLPQGDGCGPIEEFEPDCGACLGVNCCDLALECTNDESCACLSTCLLDGGSNGMCKNACDIKADEPAELAPLLGCVADVCDASCS